MAPFMFLCNDGGCVGHSEGRDALRHGKTTILVSRNYNIIKNLAVISSQSFTNSNICQTCISLHYNDPGSQLRKR